MNNFKEFWKEQRFGGILDDSDLVCVACGENKKMRGRRYCNDCQRKDDTCNSKLHSQHRKLTDSEILSIWGDSKKAVKAGWL